MAIARCQNCGKPEGRRQTYVSRAFVPQSWQVARFTMVSHLTPFWVVGSFELPQFAQLTSGSAYLSAR
jgi:hypothetical protein